MFSDALRSQAEQLLAQCRAKGQTLATAESCTGGLISALLTDIAGSSDVFMCGYVTYSYKSKTDMLGVGAALITKHGAVSEVVAKAMATGALMHADTDIAIGVTGIAGPGGGTPQKPVGMVCIAVATRRGIKSEVCQFNGNRSEIRLQSVAKALAMAAASL